MTKIDEINALISRMDFQDPRAECNVESIELLRDILGSESSWISDGHKYTLVIRPLDSSIDESPWHISKESWFDGEEDVPAMDPSLADAIQKTLENPDDFMFVVRVVYQIEHFEHNGRLVNHMLSDAGLQDTDGEVFSQAWRMKDYVEAMAVLNTLTELPLLGEASVTWAKIFYTQEDRAEDAAARN